MYNARKYQETQVMTASPMQLVLMMYDECLQTLERAENAFAIEGPERIQNINNLILHAEDIITELAVSLDMEKGGEIAKNLHRLYDFMIFHLSQANVKHVVQPVREVRKMMLELREAWGKVADQEPQRDDTAAPGLGKSSILING
jgi:flagellar protein FliS